MTRRTPWIVIVSLLALPALPADRPVAGDNLQLDDPNDTDKRRGRFVARQDPAIDPTLTADPRLTGATLRVSGNGDGDGDTGAIVLPAAGWRGLGKPAGSKGYEFRDRAGIAGVRKVVLKSGEKGGSWALKASGPDWDYRIEQPQQVITVSLSIGDDTYCAQFADFSRNAPPMVAAKNATRPVSCRPPFCGNGLLEVGEGCDDGNAVTGDGCSATCELESAAALCEGITPVDVNDIHVELILPRGQRFEHPVQVTAPPLDVHRLFVVEQDGTIRVIKDGVKLNDPFLDLSALVSCCGEQGLLGLAFHPRYAENGRFFVNYINRSGDTVIARYQRGSDADRADAASGKILLTIDQPFANHNGGQVAFGSDRYLYVGMGDGGDADDPVGYSQNNDVLLGKMLRLDVDVETAPYYRVPPSNPRAGAGAPLGLIWSKGLRNPWRFSFDRQTGDLYIGDVGQNVIEEIDWRPRSSSGGENYGWDIFEGRLCHEPPPGNSNCPAPSGFVEPVVTYDHDGGRCSVTGGFVYRGCKLRNMRGRYFYSDYCASFIRSFVISGAVATDLRDHTASTRPNGSTIDNVSALGEDARGELYIVDHLDGEIYRVVP